MRRNLSAYCAYQNKEKKINSILKKLLYEKKKSFIILMITKTNFLLDLSK